MADIKLLVDENISWRIKRLVSQWQLLPVNELSTANRLTDKDIWAYARANDYAILTFDEDFIELQNLYNFPPKIVWLRAGNLNTSQIAQRLILHESLLEKFLLDSESGVLEIY